MAEQVGHVDDRGRPLLRIEIAGQDESILALVDTGCTAAMVLPDHEARRLGFTRTSFEKEVEFADGRRERLSVARGTISWLGANRAIDALLIAERSLNTQPDAPIALIGADLLSPHWLTIDYGAQEVTVLPSD